MSQIWVPPDIAEVCPYQIAPLTQCSQLGFMYLSLLTQLFGRSIDSVNKNPYLNYPSEVQSGFTGSQEVDISVTGSPNFLGPTNIPQPYSQQVPLGQSQIPLGPTVSPLSPSPLAQQFRSFGTPTFDHNRGPFGLEQPGFQSGQIGFQGQLQSGFHRQAQPGFQNQEQSEFHRQVQSGIQNQAQPGFQKPQSVFHGPSSYTSSVIHSHGTQASFGQYETEHLSGPLPIKPHSPRFSTGLSPVLRTDFSINHDEKPHSHNPTVTRFPDASFYLKQEFGKPDQSSFQKEYQRPSDFKYESPFGNYEENSSPSFNFDNIRRSYQDIDAAATDTKVTEEKKPLVEAKKKVKKNRRKRQAIEEYDFIVVGAGSAGCVVANRLSEVKHWKVLLLEAGSEEPDVTSVPGLAPALGRSSIDWNYRTQPEEMTCRAQREQTCAWFSGKVMGGSSAINYLVYMRGNKRDYDDWAEQGNHGWSYREVLPYFTKSENNQDVEAEDRKHHGVGGPMNVERFKYADRNVPMLVGAFYETGLPLVDFNGEKQIGTMIAQSTSKDGKRMSTNLAFIRPIRYKRKNLHIIPNAQVTKLLIDPTYNIAYGVKYFKNGVWYEVRASKEVILSAGAIGSPKLLMLSGIGPEKDLEALKIPVVKNLSVGRNLQDHATTNAMLMSLSNKTSTSIEAGQTLKELKTYFKSRSSSNPLSATGPLQMSAFIRTKLANEDKSVPDIQFHFDGRNRKEFYSDSTIYLETNVLPLAYYNSINVRPILLHPESRGYLTLNKTDPIFGLPLIYPRFFTVKRDLDTLVEALKFVVKLEDTKVFKDNEVKFIKEPVQACKNYKWGSNKYFACLFISYTTTIFHPSGTCKMGPVKDKEAVVDPRLKVHGIRHLRVADASIMPNIARGNTNAPVMMIAEKVSDMIKEDWNIKSLREN